MSRILYILFVLPHLFAKSQSNNPALLLKSYLGDWIIFTDSLKSDTLCVTRTSWSSDGKRLIAAQWVKENHGITKDSCFYYYNAQKKGFSYYETDETGKKITSTSDLLINGNTWIYLHHINSTVLWRTLDVFNNLRNEISFQTQRSDDNGKSWQTTRSGREYKVK